MEPGAIVPLPMAADPAAACVPIAGEPPVARAVRALLDGPVAPGVVVVVVAEPLAARVRDVLDEHTSPEVEVCALPVTGDRADAIAAGLEHLASEALSTILVHDVRHPLVPGEVTGRVIAGLAAGHGIVVPVVPMTDSVKAVDGRGAVVATVDRATLLTVQYPRGFASSTLRELVAAGAEDELDGALAAGLPIATVDGHADAARFTMPDDAALLEAIIASRR
jgi:2-C-methyl-D-erythritol 4-phosphate cytidylyltransferase